MEDMNTPATVAELADDEVRLSDGRVLKMKESTGADDAAVAQMLGDNVSITGAGGQILVQATALFSVVTIDGEQRPRLVSYKDYIAFARSFKSKDLRRIMQKYAEMNMELDPNVPLA